jgi:hypothetical protein
VKSKEGKDRVVISPFHLFGVHRLGRGRGEEANLQNSLAIISSTGIITS